MLNKGIFWDFLYIDRGIELETNKAKAKIEVKPPSNKKEL